jgi:hypothetical protein
MAGESDIDTTRCPGCGLELTTDDVPPTDRYNASPECWQLFGELTAYTMSKNDPAFIQQHCVDAYGAQHSGGETKSITTAFSLVGLYLFLEHGYTGREVQQAHTTLGEQDRSWPELSPPDSPGEITVQKVLDANPEDERTRMIERWAESVWQTWEASHQWVREVCSESLDIDQ